VVFQEPRLELKDFIMLRYEFSEGGSNKFWEIVLKDLEVLTHYGRIGSAGQGKSSAEVV